MSRKQFISAEEHLAKLGLTVQQAFDFIAANVDKPEVIYSAAFDAGVTNSMLNEITNISTSTINDYFSAADLPFQKLDYTSMLINFDLGILETLVDFNNNTGILSNSALRETVKPLVVDLYDDSFESVIPYLQPNDGVYDSDELGVGHLTNVPATSDNLESLFYGSLINIFKTLDQTELNQIQEFQNNDANQEDFQALLIESLSDAPENFTWSDEQLADLVSSEAAHVITTLWSGIEPVGILDPSYLGLATI
ncbi:MAG: hypothetical protein H6936_16345 [Burkholderiales bacterium]|nr:hypothetical protein [Nitrosomonas sp.]MCP5276383.1 hypothetical protein [Burkholderiales bacterium]